MESILGFILELDKLKAVTRRTRPMGLDRFENSAEHSWQLAVLALALAPFAEPGVDTNHVVRMVLLHDVGEIDAGDLFAYAETGWEERHATELAGVRRVLGLLPAEQAEPLIALWQEFEDGVTPEARFAHALDRAMPVLLNLANKGQSWRENGIQYEQVVRRNGPAIEAACPALWKVLEKRLLAARDAGWYERQPA